ncbi:MAG: hypothetical protein FWG57_02530 [Endomicrobia bacterium]|nr:hypothetical protein [Bacillota bacterium]MCL1971851.1 hypothetical protein [Endomicrobiia bacterium]
MPHEISLKDFVKTTLEEIKESLKGKTINSSLIPIKFELSVGVSEAAANDKKAGIGLQIIQIFNAGISEDRKISSENKVLNKITFQIPLYLGNDEYEKKDEVNIAMQGNAIGALEALGKLK